MLWSFRELGATRVLWFRSKGSTPIISLNFSGVPLFPIDVSRFNWNSPFAARSPDWYFSNRRFSRWFITMLTGRRDRWVLHLAWCNVRARLGLDLYFRRRER
jgi:hypothetical protein